MKGISATPASDTAVSKTLPECGGNTWNARAGGGVPVPSSTAVLLGWLGLERAILPETQTRKQPLPPLSIPELATSRCCAFLPVPLDTLRLKKKKPIETELETCFLPPRRERPEQVGK